METTELLQPIRQARRLTTDSGRKLTTYETNAELITRWAEKYDAIWANEVRVRRTTRRAVSPETIDSEIRARKDEWDAYVAERLTDLTTAREQG